MTPTETHADWAERMRKRRKDLGLTQCQIAELVDVTQTTVSLWENGKNMPSDTMKWRLAAALGMRIADLFPWPAHRPQVGAA